MKIPAQPKVILRSCRDYDPERIRTIIREGLEELGLRPFGRTLVKPNLVAAGPLFPFAYTRPEFGEGVLRALRDVGGSSMTELAAGERCGITVPTRVAFRESGWDAMLKKIDVKRYCFEEEQQVEIPISHPNRLRDYLFTPEPVARADFFVNCPKFKAHPWTTVTFSLKAYIGIQDDRHRLIDHDHKLNEKIADLQHIVQPSFIAIDAITAGEGRMLTPTPFPLGLIIMGNSQVAFDAVCCSIIGVDPMSVDHIRLASEHGFGTTDLSKIAITGDVTLEEAQKRAAGFKVGLIRVEKYFEGTNITAYAGPPPEAEAGEYCWGGCPGAIEEAIEILRVFDKETDKKMPRLHVVFGKYDGDIDAKPGEKVIFIGDCVDWKGKINGNLIEMKSLYKERNTYDPHTVKSEDIFVKLATAKNKLRGDVVRLEGCPVSVAEQVLALVSIAEKNGLKNPYYDRDNMMSFGRAYLGWKARVTLNKLQRKRYQQNGAFASRGQAAPELGP
ncbi:MAG: DUF362 domain-containing protein [Deltaproteobacteria bacterium]|nr:DUF362 domain-containing protein [Deltaproteobacteria bacterium]MDQ3296397.1 DUF362 domain-containing protein [Myxococcota bacterium]